MSRQMSNQIQDLRDHAERFRRLARVVEDKRNEQQLLDMASDLERQADKLAKGAGPNSD